VLLEIHSIQLLHQMLPECIRLIAVESGSNTGSNFCIFRYLDSGSFLDNALKLQEILVW
jgi:hypothetical protein